VVSLPDGVNINNLIEDLRIYSWQAADILLNYSEKIKDVNSKNQVLKSLDLSNPVTEADLEVNEMIINAITGKYSDIDWDILSEENVKKNSKFEDFKSDWLWILDPLDGTKDFLQETGEYAMHLALNYQGRPYIGIVLIPSKNELWIAVGGEVWCEKRKNKSFEKYFLDSNKSLDEMILVTSKNHRNDNLKSLIEKICFKKVINMGSIGCKLASIIRGESDIYISLSLPGNSAPKDWDFAAPEAILKAAGGAITNINNQDLFYGKPNFEQGGIVIASNNNLRHQNICSQLRELINKYEVYPETLN
jgi:3'(2'), 5'-bisphosphate nucleotidase